MLKWDVDWTYRMANAYTPKPCSVKLFAHGEAGGKIMDGLALTGAVSKMFNGMNDSSIVKPAIFKNH